MSLCVCKGAGAGARRGYQTPENVKKKKIFPNNWEFLITKKVDVS